MSAKRKTDFSSSEHVLLWVDIRQMSTDAWFAKWKMLTENVPLNNLTTAQELCGHLHCIFEDSYDYPRKVKLLLRVARWWNSSFRRGRVLERPVTHDTEFKRHQPTIKVAAKAFEMLCQNFFRNVNKEYGVYSTPSFWESLVNSSLFEDVLDFLAEPGNLPNYDDLSKNAQHCIAFVRWLFKASLGEYIRVTQDYYPPVFSKHRRARIMEIVATNYPQELDWLLLDGVWQEVTWRDLAVLYKVAYSKVSPPERRLNKITLAELASNGDCVAKLLLVLIPLYKEKKKQAEIARLQAESKRVENKLRELFQ